jgi:hypothetical protein
MPEDCSFEDFSHDGIVYGAGYRLDDPEFESQQKQWIFLFSETSTSVLWPIQPRIT